MSAGWTTPLKLHALARGPVRVHLEPDEAERAKVAKQLGLESLPALTADVTVRAWLDGAEIAGRFEGVVGQLCSVSLDAFEQPVSGGIEVRAVPAGSPNAPQESPGEADLDPDAPDPPEVLASDAVDLAAYVVEHLALAIDPFPRKPGAEFHFEAPAEDVSPFAVLQKLKDAKP
jgi:uncharacterized metal-binding protein YceD (DUF177 family)